MEYNVSSSILYVKCLNSENLLYTYFYDIILNDNGVRIFKVIKENDTIKKKIIIK